MNLDFERKLSEATTKLVLPLRMSKTVDQPALKEMQSLLDGIRLEFEREAGLPKALVKELLSIVMQVFGEADHASQAEKVEIDRLANGLLDEVTRIFYFDQSSGGDPIAIGLSEARSRILNSIRGSKSVDESAVEDAKRFIEQAHLTAARANLVPRSHVCWVLLLLKGMLAENTEQSLPGMPPSRMEGAVWGLFDLVRRM